MREKYANYIPHFLSVTMTLNGIITKLAVAIPIINKSFSININAEIRSDVYSISMKYNSGLGVIIPLVLDYFMIIIDKVSINVKEHFGF
ncbi:hypothetical protein IFN73_11585 [Francisella tularensis subsp. holarctica]|nr:hypothetical protein [Francisella tularensis subsp. holarctica]